MFARKSRVKVGALCAHGPDRWRCSSALNGSAAVSYQLRQVEDVGDGGAYSDPAGQVPHGGGVGGHPVAAAAAAARTGAGLRAAGV